MIIYPRSMLPNIEKELDTKQAVVITGMRGVGKTTILNYLFNKIASKNKVIFDFENPLHRKIFEEENYDLVWENLKQFSVTSDQRAYIFLDEVQNLPKISSLAKYMIDHFNTKFFLTGSSSFYLENLFPESMSRRKLVFELYPLTFSEFLTFSEVKRENYSTFFEKSRGKNYILYQKLIPFWKEYMEYGGFPEIVLEKNINRKKELLSEIFTSYYEKDVKSLADFRDLSKLRDCILLLCDRVGSKADIAKLASSLALSRETVYHYLEFLQDSYLINLLPKHTGSTDRRVAGGKKVYLCDAGLLNYLGHPSSGVLLESAVFTTLRPNHTLSYYDKEGRSEIDFVVDGKIGIEVKTSSSKREGAHLALRANSARLSEFYIISQEYTKLPQTILATNI